MQSRTLLRSCTSSWRRASVTVHSRAPARCLCAPADPAAGTAPGSLWMWGKIDDSRMGMRLDHLSFGARDVAMGPTIAPMHNPNLPPLRQVVCRASKTIALGEDGSVWSWGTCDNGSLGHGAGVRVVSRPKKVEALAGIPIVDIAAGDTATAALSNEGEVFTWGWGGSFWEGNGGLGHGDNTTQPAPALVEALTDAKARITKIAVGAGHMVALDSTGKVWTWGNASFGRCGNGNSSQPLPQRVELLEPMTCVAVAAGSQSSLALTSKGEVWAWGKNDAGQLGLGGNMVMDLNTMEQYPVCVDVDADSEHAFNGTIVAISASGTTALALSRSGLVWQWGQRTFLSPSPLEFGYHRVGSTQETVKLTAVGLAAGDGVSAVLDAKGRLFTWGKNFSTGMLGHKTYGAGQRRPLMVDALAHVPLSCASFGAKHAAAIVGNPQAAAPPALK